MIASTAARVGIAYRPTLAPWVASRPEAIECLEVTAEDFYRIGESLLRRLADLCPLVVHCARLSLGTPGPIEPDELSWLARVVAAADPLWVSDHVGFSRTAEVDLGWPVPVVPGPESLAAIVGHAREIQARLKRPFLVENIVHFLPAHGVHAESELLNELCRSSGCGLLLDVTALAVNARNHRFDPRHWLRALAIEHVVQLHVGGYAHDGDRWHDCHRSAVPEDVLELATEVLRAAPVRAVILEYDATFPAPAALEAELDRLRVLAAAAAHGVVSTRDPGSA